VRLIHVTLAEPAYRARRAHTSSLSPFSSFPVVALSNQPFSLPVYPFTTAFSTSKSQQQTLLINLLNQTLLCDYWLSFLPVDYLAINRFSKSSPTACFLLPVNTSSHWIFQLRELLCLLPVQSVPQATRTASTESSIFRAKLRLRGSPSIQLRAHSNSYQRYTRTVPIGYCIGRTDETIFQRKKLPSPVLHLQELAYAKFAALSSSTRKIFFFLWKDPFTARNFPLRYCIYSNPCTPSLLSTL